MEEYQIPLIRLGHFFYDSFHVVLAIEQQCFNNTQIVMSQEINKRLLGLQERIETLEKMLKEKSDLNQEWLTPAQVISILDITPRTLHNYRNKALIGFTKVGPRKFLYRRESIEELIRDKYQEPLK